MEQIKKNIELAYLDDLTGLYNRRYLYNNLPELLSKSEKLSLFMIDLDGFKAINDTFGHLEGDHILIELAKILTDTIGSQGIVTRYAGDEFTVMLPHVDKTGALAVADNLLKNVSKKPLRGKDGNKTHPVTLSLGIAVYPDDSRKAEEIIEKADQALYSSKKMGKNRITTTDQIVSEVAILDNVIKNLSCPKFINRKEELSKLHSVVEAKEESVKKGLLVSGESGIGKTRLLNEFLSLLTAKNIAFANIACVEGGVYKPYGALLEGLRGYLNASKANEQGDPFGGLEKEELAELANLDSFLGEILVKKGAKVSGTPEKNRSVLHKAFIKIFEKISTVQPFLFAIDDIHWIDAGSLAVIYFLLKNPKVRLFLYATFLRDNLLSQDEYETKKPFSSFYAKTKYKEIFEEVELNPLSEENMRELLVSVFGGMEVSVLFVDTLNNSTKGNPFLFGQIVKSFIDKKLIYFSGGKWNLADVNKGDISVSFEDVKKSQFEKSDEEMREFLTQAASLGESFNLDILKEVFNMNEGHLLDVVDKAQKLGVIKPKEHLGAGEFSFVNAKTKDAFYKFLDKDKAASLHKKLAEILEDYYKDDLDRISPNILSHYKKAGESSKVDEYTQRASRSQDYEEIISYIDSIVKEEAPVSPEEILEKPLSVSSKKILTDVIVSLRASIANALLYQPTNQTRINSQKEAYEGISNLLQFDPSVTFSEVGGELLINGEELEKKELRKTLGFAFASLLADHRILSVTFKRGLSIDEFVFFLDMLSRTEGEIKRKGGFSNALKENKVRFVRVNEVHYEKVSELASRLRDSRRILKDLASRDPILSDALEFSGEGVVLKSGSHANLGKIVDSLASMITNIAEGEGESVEKAGMIFESLQKIGGQLSKVDLNAWGKIKGNLSKSFSSLDPKLKALVLKKDVPYGGGKDDVISDILSASEDKDIVDTAVSALQVKKLSSEDYSQIFKILLSDPARREKLLPIIQSELFKKGMPKQDIAAILGQDLKSAKTGIIDEVVQNFLDDPTKKYSEDEISKNIKPVIEGLVLKNKDDIIINVINRISVDLGNSAFDIRNSSVKGIADVADILLSREKYQVLSKTVESLEDRLHKEPDARIYGVITAELANIAGGLIYKEDYKAAGEIIKCLKAEIPEEAGRSAAFKKYISDAINSISDFGITKTLVSALSKKLETGSEDILYILTNLSVNTIDSLIKLLEEEDSKADPFDAYKRRRSVAIVVKKMGKDALENVQAKLSDKRPHVVKNIIEVLGYLNDERVVGHLEGLIKHPSSLVRKELVLSLRKIGALASLKLLIPMLKDNDEDVRNRAHASLEELGNKETLDELKKYLSDKEIADKIKTIIENIERKYSS